MCHGCVEFLSQHSYKTARGMEHSGWTLIPLCLHWCLPLRLRPLRSQTALQRLCLTPANCLTLSDGGCRKVNFSHGPPAVRPVSGTRGRRWKQRSASLTQIVFCPQFFLFSFFFLLVAAVYHRRVVLVMAASLWEFRHFSCLTSSRSLSACG